MKKDRMLRNLWVLASMASCLFTVVWSFVLIESALEFAKQMLVLVCKPCSALALDFLLKFLVWFIGALILFIAVDKRTSVTAWLEEWCPTAADSFMCANPFTCAVMLFLMGLAYIVFLLLASFVLAYALRTVLVFVPQYHDMWNENLMGILKLMPCMVVLVHVTAPVWWPWQPK